MNNIFTFTLLSLSLDNMSVGRAGKYFILQMDIITSILWGGGAKCMEWLNTEYHAALKFIGS